MQPAKIIAGRFEVGELLGSGAMGRVYRGIDKTNGDVVAIKTIRPDVANLSPDVLKRFQREGLALSKLDHRFIVKILAMVEETETHYLVMEYLSGKTLSDLIAAKGQLSLSLSIKLAWALADALAYIHEQQILHRDIKPSNVMLASDGTPRLMDFGIARLDDMTPMTAPGAVLGTLVYVPPEVIYGKTPDPQADIWALGMTLYKMLTGELPFKGKTAAAVITEILNEPVPSLIESRPDAPPALIGLVELMLHKEKAQRIDSMQRVRSQLRGLMKS